MYVMSYILSAHINFYFIISTMFNFKNSLWGHSCFKIHSYYFRIWFLLRFVVIWIIRKLTMLVLNMIFINFKFIYNFAKLTIMIILTIPLTIFSPSLKDGQNLRVKTWSKEPRVPWVLFQGLDMTYVVVTLIYNLKFYILDTQFNIAC